jgi:hypothetical protein
MTRIATLFKSALLSAMLLAANQSFAFDFSHMVMRTAEHAIVSKGKKFAEEVSDRASTSTLPATGTIEAAFSPNEGAEALVLKVINSARSEIRMLSYSFTSAPVTQY